MDSVLPGKLRVKIKDNEKRDKYLDPVKEVKKAAGYENYSSTIFILDTQNRQQMFRNGAGRVGSQSMRRDYLNYSIVEVGQYTEESPGDLR